MNYKMKFEDLRINAKNYIAMIEANDAAIANAERFIAAVDFAEKQTDAMVAAQFGKVDSTMLDKAAAGIAERLHSLVKFGYAEAVEKASALLKTNF